TADLKITKTDNVTTAIPGGTLTYTIVVSNLGPSDVTGATVFDDFPAQITSVSYTSVGIGGAASNLTARTADPLNETVDLPAGSSITYTVMANIAPAATGTMSNTVTVTAPAGATDPAGNESS